MRSEKDPYHILGVARDASQAGIRSAYNAIAKAHHPDRNPGNTASLERFVEATEAYEMLSDPDKRSAADISFRNKREQEGIETDLWGMPLGNPFVSSENKTSARYASLGEDPWAEPPYGAIAAVIALLGIAGLVIATFLFV